MKSEAEIVPTTTPEQLAAQEEKLGQNKETVAQIMKDAAARKEKIRVMKVQAAQESLDGMAAARARLQQNLGADGRAERNAAFLKRTQKGSQGATEQAA